MTTQRKVVKSIDELIAAFGGLTRCGRRWDVSKQAVSKWRQIGVPPGYHYRMSLELESAGYIIDARALGWV